MKIATRYKLLGPVHFSITMRRLQSSERKKIALEQEGYPAGTKWRRVGDMLRTNGAAPRLPEPFVRLHSSTAQGSPSKATRNSSVEWI